MQHKNSKKARKPLGMLLFVLLNLAVIAFTLHVELRRGGADAVRPGSISLQPMQLLGASFVLLVAVIAEIAKYVVMLRRTQCPHVMKTAVEVALYGRYYDCITPSGIGGQPFQIYFLNKNGLSPGESGVIPVGGFLSSQIGFVLAAVAALLMGFRYIHSTALIVLAILGFAGYLAAPSFVLLFTLRPRAADKILAFFVRLLTKLHLLKTPDETAQKLRSTLCEYQQGFRYLLREKATCVLLLALSVVYQAALCCLPFFVLGAFGGSLSWAESFTTTIVLYSAITFIPTPGNAGAAEGSFYAVFSSLTQGHIFWAMLVWRLFCYYSFILFGVLLYLFNLLRAAACRRRHLCDENE